MADYDIGEAFKAIENDLMASMIRNMKQHRLEEIDENKEWEMWQALQLKALEQYKQKNAKKYEKQFKNINQEIAVIISAARAEGNMQQEIAVLEAIRKGYKPPKARKSGTQLNGEFFKLNDRKLDALIKATENDFDRAERAILRMANDQYRKIIFNAQVYANTGAGTYEKAVDMATKDFLSRGINCIEYKNGARHTISEYADMAIKTASKRAYLTGEGEMRQEWGIHTVIMNKRGNACPKCLPFAGKVLIDDVWSNGKQSDGPYLLMSKAMAAGLYHPRCKDVHTTYFEGINTPGASYTKQELKQIEESYRKEQEEQYVRHQAEKFERLAEFSLNEENKRKYAGIADIWRKKLQHTNHSLADMKKIVDEFEDNLNNVQNADVKTLLSQSKMRIKFKKSSTKKAYFDPEQRVVCLAASSTPETIAHELFHEIDSTYRITESGMLKASVYNDYKRLQNFATGYGMSIQDMLYSKYKDAFVVGKHGVRLKPEYRGISDILNGMSGGEIKLGYIHSAGYWKNDGALEAETWAQFGRILYSQNDDVIGMLKFVCPEVYTEIMSILKGMIK